MLCPVFDTLTISSHWSFSTDALLRFPSPPPFSVDRKRPTSESIDPSKSRNVLPRSVRPYPNGLYPAGNGLNVAAAAPPRRSDDTRFASDFDECDPEPVPFRGDSVVATVPNSIQQHDAFAERYLLFLDNDDGMDSHALTLPPPPAAPLIPSVRVNEERRARTTHHTLYLVLCEIFLSLFLSLSVLFM